MPRQLIVLSQHAKERWQQRIGRGSLFRSIRRARRAGPHLQRLVNLGEGNGLEARVDYRNAALYLVRPVNGELHVLTVLRLNRKALRSTR